MKNKYKPKAGDIIYVDTCIYLSHGIDDMVGGRARIFSVVERDNDIWIKIYGWLDEEQAWSCLEPRQKLLEAQFKDSWAYHKPDRRPEFNEI